MLYKNHGKIRKYDNKKFIESKKKNLKLELEVFYFKQT